MVKASWKSEGRDADVEALILAARKGEQGAFAELNAMYEGLLVSVVNSFSGKIPDDVYSREDLMQEGLLAFYRAAETFDVSNGKVTFGLYAKTCITNRMISLLRRANTVKRRQQKTVSFSENEKCGNMLDYLIASANGENGVYADGIMARLESTLSKKEKAVLLLFIKGLSYAQIGKALDVDEKSVDNALCRIRRKLKAIVGGMRDVKNAE